MARDYVSSRAPGKKRAGKGRQKEETPVGFYIKLGFILLLIVTIVSGIFYLKFNSVKPAKPDAKQNVTQETTAADRRPEKDPYRYRKLLESSEVKTGTSDQKRRNEQSYESHKRPDVIIDPKKKRETKAEEAARAQAILNGSLNTPRDDVTHTVKIGSNDDIIYVDGQKTQTAAAGQTPGTANTRVENSRTTAAQVESGRASQQSQTGPSAASSSSKTGNSSKPAAAPDTKAKPVAGSSKPSASKQENSAAAATRKQDSRAGTAKNNTTKGTEQNKVNFYMQCGAFKSPDQANRLRGSIQSSGYPSTVSKAVVNSVTWYRVIVGPYATKGMAEDVTRKLKKVVNNCNIYKH